MLLAARWADTTVCPSCGLPHVVYSWTTEIRCRCGALFECTDGFNELFVFGSIKRKDGARIGYDK